MMISARVTKALALVALSVLAACGPRAAEQTPASSDAIEADIAAGRRAGQSAGAPLASSPLDASVAAVPTPPAAPPPETSMTAGTLPGNPATAGGASPGDPQIGRRFAFDNCRPCHVVAPDQASTARFANAPDFRTIAKLPQTNPARLYVWLTNPHPTMPTLHLTPEEASNVIAYIMGLHG